MTRGVPEAVSVADRSVIVAGPPGYCIDRSALRDRPEGAFVLLGSCAALASDASLPHPASPGVLTVSISERALGTRTAASLLEELEAYFRTEAGRAALSRSGAGGTVEILDTRTDGGVLYLHTRDEASAGLGMAEETWRALFAVNGRLVTLAVNAPVARPLPANEGRRTLSAFTRRIRTANGSDGAT